MDWIGIHVYVPDIDAAVDYYVHRNRLFTVENDLGSGLDRFVMLRYRDRTTPFRLTLIANPEQTDTKGLQLPAARQARITLPMSDCEAWAKEVFGENPPIEDTPWGGFIVLRDPWGHIISILTKREYA